MADLEKVRDGQSGNQESLLQTLRNVGPKLIPFFKALGLYCVVFIPVDQPSILTMCIKCLPILALALFVSLHGISRTHQYKFQRRILAGLLFSCLGDACLVWPRFFLHGMAAFGMAQCFYIRAFGFKPLNLGFGILAYASTAINLQMILPGLLKDELPVLLGVPIYSFALTTMVWRSVSSIRRSEEAWTWTTLSSGIGGLSFAVSDTVLALDKFQAEIPYSQVIVMATYYLAQFGIALSVVNHKEIAVNRNNSSSTKIATNNKPIQSSHNS